MRWIFSPPRPMTRPTSWSGIGYSSTTFSPSSLTTSRLAVFAFFAVGPLFSAALSLGRFWPVTPESLFQKLLIVNIKEEIFYLNEHFTKVTFHEFKIHEIHYLKLRYTTTNGDILDFNIVWSNLKSSASRVSSLIDCKKVNSDASSTWAYHDEELSWLKEQREWNLLKNS